LCLFWVASQSSCAVGERVGNGPTSSGRRSHTKTLPTWAKCLAALPQPPQAGRQIQSPCRPRALRMRTHLRSSLKRRR
jgi:hypothetical protein